MVHAAGGLVYYDGANLNAILGVARPGDMGFDIVHSNLHKTFATPHGGGGPGAGPVAVVEHLAPYLPGPLPEARADGTLGWEMPAASIGRVHGGHGNFLVVVRALAYMRALGGPGLRRVAERSVLNARYLESLIGAEYDRPYREPCMHEFVASAARLKRETGVRAADVAKALLDLGFHAPTMYFPLIVEEALMVEPTETESPETVEALAAALLAIARLAREDPAGAHRHPRSTPVRRPDDARAARHPVLTWFMESAVKPAMGIDVGGSGIKGAVVDPATGELLTPRIRVATPTPATPKAVARAAARLVAARRVVGPSRLHRPRRGTARRGAHRGQHRPGLGRHRRRRPSSPRPPACPPWSSTTPTAPALPRCGPGRAGDGKGWCCSSPSAPASAAPCSWTAASCPTPSWGTSSCGERAPRSRPPPSAKTREGLTWVKWARRVDKYLAYVESLFWPDLLIVGGGVSRDYRKWVPLLHPRAEIVPARFRNNAGIVGAALLAAGDRSA